MGKYIMAVGRVKADSKRVAQQICLPRNTIWRHLEEKFYKNFKNLNCSESGLTFDTFTELNLDDTLTFSIIVPIVKRDDFQFGWGYSLESGDQGPIFLNSDKIREVFKGVKEENLSIFGIRKNKSLCIRYVLSGGYLTAVKPVYIDTLKRWEELHYGRILKTFAPGYNGPLKIEDKKFPKRIKTKKAIDEIIENLLPIIQKNFELKQKKKK